MPIMISLKQRGMYILTVYPILVVALGYYIYPILKIWIDKIELNSKGFKVFKFLTLIVVVLSLGSSIFQVNRIGRDKEMIMDSKAVIEVVGEDETISICAEMYTNWSLHGYFSRYGNVSLDSNKVSKHHYYLSVEDCNQEVLLQNYQKVDLATEKYHLYQRVD